MKREGRFSVHNSVETKMRKQEKEFMWVLTGLGSRKKRRSGR